MDEAEGETRPLTYFHYQPGFVIQLNRVVCELREDLEHERNRRLDLVAVVNHLRSDRGRTNLIMPLRSLRTSGYNGLFVTSWWNLVRISLGFSGRYPSFRRRRKYIHSLAAQSP